MKYFFIVFFIFLQMTTSVQAAAYQVSAKQPDIIIKLKSNPTTGYSWFLVKYNSHLIKPINHTYVPPISQLVGASGEEVWRFRAEPAAFIVPQQTKIVFVYSRPWEDAEKAEQQVFITISTH